MGEIIIQYLQTFPKWFQMSLLAMLFAAFIYVMFLLGHKQIKITMKGIEILDDDDDNEKEKIIKVKKNKTTKKRSK